MDLLTRRPRTVAVIGAGVAGAAVAYALVQRGLTVTVFDAACPGAGASGNPLAVFRPVLARAATPALRLTRAAFLHNLSAWAALDDVVWARCGVLHLARDDADAVKQSQALAFLNPEPDLLARWGAMRRGRWRGGRLIRAGCFFHRRAGCAPGVC
jgi:Glycine/D-amino acid oxidases (deaminating)